MIKLIPILMCSAFLLFCKNVYGQDEVNKKSVAVVPAEGGSVSGEIKDGITNGLEEGVFKSGEYKLLARGESFAKALSELQFQETGAVADDQLIGFGKALGANLVCYASVNKYSDVLYRVSYRMIDVASGEIVNVGSETVRDGIAGLLTATDNISKKLFGLSPVSKPIVKNSSQQNPAVPKKTVSVTTNNGSKLVNELARSPIVYSVLNLMNIKLGSKINRYRTEEERFDQTGSGGKIEDLVKVSAKTVFASPQIESGKIIFFCPTHDGKGRDNPVFLFIDGNMIAATTVLNGFAAIVPDDGSSHLITVWRNSDKIYSTPVNFSQKKEYTFVWIEKRIQLQ